MPWIAVFIVAAVYAALLAYYCVLEKQEKFWPATVLKVILSAYAAGCGIYAAILLNNYVFYIFAFGLLCAVPADYFLQFIKIDLRKYRFGIFFFGAMHVCLLVSFYLIYPVTFYEFIIFAVFIGILVAFQTVGKWKIGKEKIQLSVYTVLVVLMAAKAVSLYITIPNPASFVLMVSLGGLFFFISDLFLGIWAYSAEKFVYLALNRIIYFTGQLCLAFYLVLIFIGW